MGGTVQDATISGHLAANTSLYFYVDSHSTDSSILSFNEVEIPNLSSPINPEIKADSVS
jgi:hypothetical protein